MKQKAHSTEYSKRRKQFLKELKDGVAVIRSAPDTIRNNDVHYEYRQDSDFYYLTGFEESNAICLFAPKSKTPFQMFVQPKDKTKEIWEGHIHGPEVAESQFGADAAHPSIPENHFDEAFVEAMLEADTLYYSLGRCRRADERILDLLKKARRKLGRTGRSQWPIHDPEELLGELRCLKSADEIQVLKKAVEITANAHKLAMQSAKPGMHEYEIEAQLFDQFRSEGAGRLGYPSIVASGPNACVLHYNQNNRKMGKEDLLLIDAGAEYQYYTADLTRTFPLKRKFTKEEKDIYGAVLKAQLECIKACKPGMTFFGMQTIASEVLAEELLRLKVLKGNVKTILKNGDQKNYYPHNIGHWLGMDVHDVGRYYVGSYDKYRPFEPGMVLTIEPGLYFGPHSNPPAKYKGIGVRIEDDILVTAKGAEVLSSALPKEIEEVEELCVG